MNKQYKVIQYQNLTDFQVTVEAHLNDGWELYENMFVYIYENRPVFCQGMTKNVESN